MFDTLQIFAKIDDSLYKMTCFQDKKYAHKKSETSWLRLVLSTL